ETVRFTFSGRRLTLVTTPSGGATVSVRVDGDSPETVSLAENRTEYPLFRSWRKGEHTVQLTLVNDAPIGVDGFVVE
ncbi:MAG: hypothetical protein D6796_11020, partial [Caldilineae bacterium]